MKNEEVKNISAHLQSYFYILTMGSSVLDIATKSTLDKKVLILFSKVKISKSIEQNGEVHQRPQYDPARHDCRLQKENSSGKNLTHITATIVVIVVINISVSCVQSVAYLIDPAK